MKIKIPISFLVIIAIFNTVFGIAGEITNPYPWVDFNRCRLNAPIKMDTFISMVVRAWGYPVRDGQKGYWAAPYYETALQLGYIKKLEETQGELSTSRRDAIRILSRALKEADPDDLSTWMDAIRDLDEYPEFKSYVLRLYAKGIITIDPKGRYQGDTLITTDEAIDLIARCHDYRIRKQPLGLTQPIECPVRYPWQHCDDPTLWSPSPLWGAGTPRFSSYPDLKREGTGAIRIDYNSADKDYFCVGFSPIFGDGTNLSEYDGMSFCIYNPDPWQKWIGIEIRDKKETSLKFVFNENTDENGEADAAGGAFLAKGPAWTTFTCLFNQIRVNHRPYPFLQEALQDVSRFLIKVQDRKEKSARNAWLLIDDIRLLKVTPKVNAGGERMPHGYPDLDPKDISTIESNLSQGKCALAAEQLLSLLEKNPRDQRAIDLLVRVYTALNNQNADRIKIKEALRESYYSTINDNRLKAFDLRDIHTRLVNIHSELSAPLSYVLTPIAIGAKYQFTTKPRVVEEAERIVEMGSDTIKITLGENGKELVTLVEKAERAEIQTVFNMPLRNYIIWTYCDMSGDLKKWWQEPEFTEQGSKEEYRQIYELTAYLLTHFNNSGKHFYLGVWESDYHLLGFALNPKEPTQLRINGFIEWMNVRQKAIEDARRTVPHKNVEVYGYAEVVRYFDALEGKSRVVNSVLPYIRVDMVSYSSYESTGDQTFNWGEDVRLATRRAFDYIAKHSPPSEVPGCRVFVGEYGYPKRYGNSPESTCMKTRDIVRIYLEYGIPFACYWNFYCNEGRPDDKDPKYAGYWMVDDKNIKQAVYFFHERFFRASREYVSCFNKENGRMPTMVEFSTKASEWLDPACESGIEDFKSIQGKTK